MKKLVAVYGSLLSGLHNHRVMEHAKGVLLDEGYSVENINMYSMGSFPSISLAHNSHGNPIKVQVYEVPEEGMPHLDRLEGYREDSSSNFYNRSPIQVVLSNGDEVEALIYHIDRELDSPVLDGDWKSYVTGK